LARRLVRRRQRQELTDEQRLELAIGPRAESAFESDAARLSAWREWDAELVEDWKLNPNHRPSLWAARRYDVGEG
jgi:hypothetical protein